MKKRIISIILILLLCLTCLPVSVFADASSSTDVEALYEQAKVLIEAEKYEEAIPLLTEAADLGLADAQNYLGACYQLGTGVEQSYEEAARYYKLAADQGNAKAQFNLGCCYYFGCGVDQSYDKALKYLTLAAEQGIPDAMFGVGACYYEKKDWTQAAEWFIKALDAGYEPDEEDEKYIADVAEYLMDQAWIYFEAEEYEEAIPLLTEAATLGNAIAQYDLGYCYEYGEGVEQNYDEALKYYMLAAEQGVPDAMFGVGDYYYAMKDWTTAAEWYLKALDAGYVPDEEDVVHLADVSAYLMDQAWVYIEQRNMKHPFHS